MATATNTVPALPAIPGVDLTRLGSMPLKEFGIALGRAREAQGLSPIDYDHQSSVIRETSAHDAAGNPIDAAVVRESASTSDLPGLMSNLMYRRLDEWFKQYEPAFKTYAHEEQVINYKVNTIVFPAQLEDALQIFQESDYRDSALSDKTLQFSLKKWGRYISLPFQVIENDDLQFLNSMPTRMTNAVDRTINKIVVRSGLEGNPLTYDGLPIFSASRASAQMGGLTGNLISGAASALSPNNIQAGLAAVNSFTGDPDLNPSGVPMNEPAKYLVVPASLAQQAAQILNSTVLIAAGTANPITTLGNESPLRQTILQPLLQLVLERYLTNPTAYYILPRADAGPLMYITQRGKGLRPTLWRNIPQRQGINGGSADEYLLTHDDILMGFSFALAMAGFKFFSSIKFSGA